MSGVVGREVRIGRRRLHVADDQPTFWERVEAGHDVTTYTLIEGDDLTILHDNGLVKLAAAAPTATRATLPWVALSTVGGLY